MTRRRFTEREVIASLIHQGVEICCYRCGEAFTLDDARKGSVGNIEKEHLHEVELDGPDEPSNCRFSHQSCHDRITNGNGATTAGSSKHRIAKATHPKRIEKFVVNKPELRAYETAPSATTPEGERAYWRCRKCGESGVDDPARHHCGRQIERPKMKSRGFGKSITRRFGRST